MPVRFIIYAVFIWVIFLYGAVNFKKFAIPYKLLILLLGLTFVSELIGRVLIVRLHNSMPAYHIISVIEYTLITFIYSFFFTGSVKKLLLYLMIPVISFAIINTVFIQTILEFPTHFILLAQGIYLLYALIGFRQMLLFPIDKPLNKQSFFWLNTALLFFSTMLFLFFGLLNYINSHNYDVRPLYTFSYVINFLYYAFILIALTANKKECHFSQLHEKH
ncbi:MAG: hypothetical protein JWR05_337 [Mucilaginibacter sp.]|nr:hypothetical protein [Mucilaginibacter sp.]